MTAAGRRAPVEWGGGEEAKQPRVSPGRMAADSAMDSSPQLSDAQVSALVAAAARARQSSYSPHSGYAVGAAVLTADDRVFLGCNVENASYGLSLCAERAAIAAAVAGGARRLRAVVVVTEADPPGTPCGACRQWMAELGDSATQVIAANSQGTIRRFSLGKLLPEAFRLDSAANERG